MRRSYICLLAMASVWGCGSSAPEEQTDVTSESLAAAEDHAGTAESFHTSGAIDTTNPFFLELGINGRSCGSCHASNAGWTVTRRSAREAFDSTDGTAPMFRPHDGAVRPDADVSTVDARRAAYAILLSRCAIRFGRTVPATAEFVVDAVDDPYGFSTTALFSNFRRIPSAANLAQASSITWSGGPGDVRVKLMGLMNSGSKGHAQRPTDVPAAQQAAGADFMLGLYFAQSIDDQAGALDAAGALGGPTLLASQPFYLGMNALGGDSVTGAPFDNESFTIFDAWEDASSGHGRHERKQVEAREQIARGEHVFYSKEMNIFGVNGVNDALNQPVIKGTCTTCHNAPNAGNHSEFRLMNTGVADGSRRMADVPLITVRNKVTGEVMQSTDLGRGPGTGLWADIGKFKVPNLRGVGARAPYFHDGSARNLHQVIEFYKDRFGVRFHGHEEADLLAFLKAI